MDNEAELIENNSFSRAFGEKQPFPDEVPRFSLSPGRSISPIDADFLLDKSFSLHHQDEDEDEELDQLCQPLSLNFVSLSDIDAQITPLKAKGLQTIFEGVFLETPPRSGGRTVIPRKKCDIKVKVLGLQSTSSSSSEEEDDEDDQVTPLCESFIDHQQQRLEDEEATDPEIIISRRSSSIKEQLVVASIAAETTLTSSFCNAFQQRLNLIPGED